MLKMLETGDQTGGMKTAMVEHCRQVVLSLFVIGYGNDNTPTPSSWDLS
jgi:hypothetical protein